MAVQWSPCLRHYCLCTLPSWLFVISKPLDELLVLLSVARLSHFADSAADSATRDSTWSLDRKLALECKYIYWLRGCCATEQISWNVSFKLSLKWHCLHWPCTNVPEKGEVEFLRNVGIRVPVFELVSVRLWGHGNSLLSYVVPETWRCVRYERDAVCVMNVTLCALGTWRRVRY
jgi:hypothetical protein